MMNYGHFETEVHLRFPLSWFFIRNMCDGGNTPGFRPHPGRVSPWAFPGAEQFQTELANNSGSEGHFETPDQWLTRLEADVIIAFFGYNESFAGQAGMATFKEELQAFIDHTSNQQYNGKSAPQLILVSPIAFENLSGNYDLPDGRQINENLSIYAKAMEQVAERNEVPFVNVFEASKKWYQGEVQLTIDGSQLNELGYRKLSAFLADEIFGDQKPPLSVTPESITQAVLDKNWFWHNDYKIPNGVHVFGRRYDPFGPDNYPYELEKIRQMTANRDTVIWSILSGEEFDLVRADELTAELPEVETNYRPGDNGRGGDYLYGQDALDKIHVAPGYKIELFASEKEFPDLANPVQISFDNKGRLWVATMPSYPHYKPGDSRPNDKLIILEDTDNDGKADNQIDFATGLHLPIGFEIASEGVYVSQGTNLKLFTDSNNDDQADSEQILLSGFDDHDTHHAISAFCADPSGAIYMGEGVFLHTNVETSYGTVRGTNGGFYRFTPQLRKLERTAQIEIPNPWGIAFDKFGQNFFLETSGPAMRWMMPSTIKPVYGVGSPKSPDLIEDEHKVRPTSGLEFVYSRHFPEDVQGDILLGNSIGYLGVKQHEIRDAGTGYQSGHRQDLVWSDDRNFRPVDLEFAPDGSLYLVDWHNILIGHMQHNARDPLRDHVHGRIYRITYPSRPLVEPPRIADASVDELFENLELPEYRARYRTRRELRGRPQEQVIEAMSKWVSSLDSEHPEYERYLLEALWVSWGMNQVDRELLKQLLNAKDYRVRAAAVRVLRYTGHQVPEQGNLLKQVAKDAHGRVRLESIVAASWLANEDGLPVIEEANQQPLDDWIALSAAAIEAHLKGLIIKPKEDEEPAPEHLSGDVLELYNWGKKIYNRDGHCGTCHQPDGQGLVASGFPPLKGTRWVLEDKDRLIKLSLKGLYGPIEVLDKEYPGQVPMTGFEKILDDDELAAVLTYVRNSFGNQASAVTAEDIERVRAATSQQSGFYKPDELLTIHPHGDTGAQ